MRDRIFSLLGVESNEESAVSMLLAQSVFLGIYLAAFDITAHSLFLAIFNEKIMARGYVISGLAGIILTSLYTWFQSRMQYKNFAVTNLISVTLITIILWIALILTPAKWVIFIVFITLGPLNILAMLGFRETTDRLFALNQSKRLTGIVETGLIIGIIITSYAIPVLLSFKSGLHNIMLISASSVLIATVIQMIIGARFGPLAVNGGQKPERPEVKKSVLMVSYIDTYTRSIVLFIVLSVITAFFVQYSFMAVTREQYPAGEDMARFLGIFTGSMMFFTILIKLFVFKYLIRNYGLRTSLVISPVILAAIVSVGIIIGLLNGYTPESAIGFLIFFILLALGRLFSISLKASMEIPSLKVIYQTIDEKIKSEVQSGILGTVNEIAALLSGLLLTGLGVLSFIKLIHFSLVLFFIILIWIFVAFRLYKEFRKSVRKTIETVGPQKTVEAPFTEQGIYKSRFSAYREFRRDYFKMISGDYSVLENIRNKWYYEKIINHSVLEQDITLIPVLKKIAINTDIDGGIRRQASELVIILEEFLSSGNVSDARITYARKTLSETRQPQTTEILRLLRDNSIEAKRLAIYMIGKFRLSDMLPEVCACLNIHGLETDAYAILRTFGQVAGDELEKLYLITSGNSNTSKTILRLLGSINSKESTGFLYSRLWSNSRQLKEVAVNCLIDCKFKASDKDKDRLLLLISDIIGLMTWNLSAKVCLEKSNDIFLLEVMKKEINRWNLFLFNILSITYDSDSIAKIRINLEMETVENLNLALELLDIVIDDAIKSKLISLLNVVKDDEKLKNLHQFFSGEVLQYNTLLEAILNRDYNLLSLWTKACTLRNIPEIKGNKMTESVVALLFSPEGILQEESAKLLARTNRELYRSASQRIPESMKKRLDKIVDGETNEMELLFEKIQFLSAYFVGIQEEELLSLAEAIIYIKDFQTGFPSFPYDCIIWSLSDEKSVKKAYLYYAEQLKNRWDKLQVRDHTSYYILPLGNVEEYLNLYPDKSSAVLKYIDDNGE